MEKAFPTRDGDPVYKKMEVRWKENVGGVGVLAILAESVPEIHCLRERTSFFPLTSHAQPR